MKPTLRMLMACCLCISGCGKGKREVEVASSPERPVSKVSAQPEPEVLNKRSQEPKSPEPKELTKLLFDSSKVDHRKIRVAIHLQANHGIDGRIGSRSESGLVLMPRRDGPKLTRGDLVKVRELDLSGKGLSDLSPLAGLTGAKSLYLNDNPLSDLAPLSGLKGLLTLSINRCQIVSLTHLQDLSGLVYLNLDNNQISDLTPVAGLKGLEILGLSVNQVTNLTPLMGLENLYHLELSGNSITDLSPLAKLTKLKYLSLDNNPNLTQSEVVNLKQALPKCEIEHNASE